MQRKSKLLNKTLNFNLGKLSKAPLHKRTTRRNSITYT